MSQKWFYALLVIEVLVLAAARWPHLMSLADFAHTDPGAVLSLAQLSSSGLRPGVDFTYLYGLGTVGFGDIVFGLFGISPLVYVVSCLCLAIVYAVVVGWAAIGAGARGPIYAVVVAGVAAGLPLPAANYVHLLEPILLSAAVGFYCRNRPGTALAIVTAAVFVKPALAYVFGLLLVLDGLRAALASHSSRRVILMARFLPAAGVGIVLLAIVTAWYGRRSVLATLFPAAGLSVFQAEGYGFFFGTGRYFWSPPGIRWTYYFGTPTGCWLAMTVLLATAALVVSVRWLRGHIATPAERGIFLCGLTHILFVLFVFGPPTAWIYDFNLLIIGSAALFAARDHRRWLAWAAAGCILLGCYTQSVGSVRNWRTWARVPGTSGLYADGSQAEGWRRLTAAADTERVFVFNYLGGVASLDARMHAPESWCLYWWNAPEAEIERTRNGLRQADLVVISRYLDLNTLRTHPINGPIFAKELEQFPIVEEWPSYRVLRRLAGKRGITSGAVR